MLSRLMTRKEQLLLLGVVAAICLGALALYFHDQSKPSSAVPAHAVGVLQPHPKPEQIKEPDAPIPIPSPSPIPQTPAPAPTAPVNLAVSVTGGVRAPGLYTLPDGARVQDALTAAGGALDNADLSDINLAAKLIDATTLTIPVPAAAGMKDGRLVYRKTKAAAVVNLPEYTISGWKRPQQQQAAPDTASDASSGLPQGSPSATGPINLNTATQEALETLPGIGPKLARQIMQYRNQTPFTSIEDLSNVEGIGEKRLDAIRNLVTVK